MRCWAKKAYSKKEAQHVKNYLRTKGRLVRIYQCRCGHWHLTHVPLFESCLPSYIKDKYDKIDTNLLLR